MSNVIPFPILDPVITRAPDQPAVILILPVVRVDREDGTPAPHRQRRRGKTSSSCFVDDAVFDGQ